LDGWPGSESRVQGGRGRPPSREKEGYRPAPRTGPGFELGLPAGWEHPVAMPAGGP
jgi:hypothetical protein